MPVLFFAAYLVVALMEARAAESLWLCHVSNLLLGFGMLLDQPKVIRLAVVLIVAGIPLWIFDIAATREISAVSILSHLGGLIVGLYALHRVRMRGNPWLWGVLLFLAIQQICRWVTAPALNVNLAHRIYDGSEPWVHRYDLYWLATTLLFALFLWIVGRVMLYAFPPLEKG